MSDHHPTSPSIWPSILACSHFVSTQTTSADADAGTAAHDALAKLLTLQTPQSEILPQVDWAKRVILDMANGMLLYIENKVEFSDSELEYYGTPDCYWIDLDGCLHVVDFKTFADGSIDHFPQLMGYALAICSKNLQLKVKPIHLSVLAGGAFTVFDKVVSYDECYKTASNVFSMKRNAEHLPRITNPHCKFCANCASCPLALMEVTNMNQDMVTHNEGKLTAQKMVALLEQCTIAEGIIDSIRAKIKADIELLGAIENNGIRYEIREENGTAKVADMGKLIGYLQSQGSTTQDLLDNLKLGMPAAVKLLRKADFTIKNDKDARTALAEFFEIPKVRKLKKVVATNEN
jgi:hypothetical protein